MAVAFVERSEQESIYGLSPGTKRGGSCKEMAVVERWTLVEVRLYVKKKLNCYLKVIIGKCIKISLRSFCTLNNFIKKI